MRMLPTENFRSPAALLLFFGTTVLGLAIDLFTKVWSFNALADGSSYPFIPGWLHFHITTNHGAVFGIGQGQRTFFLIVSVAAIAFLTALFARSGRQRGYQLILGMLLAGVLGNMYDRIVFGYVRDMIHALPRWPNLFPWIFNVADSLLVCGVILMVVRGFLVPDESPEPSPDKAATTTPAPEP